MIHLWVGIDVSKDTLDISATLDGHRFDTLQVCNDPKGFAQLKVWLSRRSEFSTWRINLEATSAYHRAVVLWFAAQEVQILVLNPKQARDLAKGLGILRKSDRTDARVLALCAKMAWREPTPLPSGARMALQEVCRRLDVLTRQRAGERRRLQKPGLCEETRESCRRLIQFLDEEIERLETSWAKLLEGCQNLHALHRNLLSIPGVGKVLARTAVSEMYVTERPRTSRECVAYTGLAPQEQTSGTSLRRQAKTFSTGKKRLRTALYMGAIVLTVHDPLCRDLYMRILAQGKPAKVGIVAVMAKTMRRIAAVANRETPWVRT